MASTETASPELLSLCDEAREIHVHWGMILGQVIVCIINLASTVITGIFAHFVFNDKVSHSVMSPALFIIILD